MTQSAQLHRKKKLFRLAGVGFLVVGIVLLVSAFIRDQGEEYSTTEQSTPKSLLSFDIDDESGNEEFVDNTSSTYRLVIPKIGVDMPIVIGETDEKAGLDGGAWLIPGTAVPDTNNSYNNTVLSAHRFKYTSGKYTFFEVDQLIVGDDIIIKRGEKELKYKVIMTEVVLPSAVRILDKTDQPMLTLFTCTPKFSSKYRLVIYALPVE